MVKRHPAMQPLSRDHFTELTLAQRLKKGHPENLASNWPTNDNIQEQANRAKQIFDIEVSQHLKIEEDYLYLVAKEKLGPKGYKLLNKILEDHIYFKKAFQELNEGSLDQMRNKMISLGERLENHIREEERELFPLIEKVIPENELNEIGIRLNRREYKDCSLLL
ncbi:MAG: hemerythrin domain-containing protein [Candidatus Hodarchaeales archaeon]|jgi:hemerythrin-like domain-containing protein